MLTWGKLYVINVFNRDCSIGKVFQKDQNFVEYTRQALRKLSLPDEQVSSAFIIDGVKRSMYTAHRFRNKLIFVTI